MSHIKDKANPAVDRVLIYAGDGGCYWRENGCGYTNAQNAGVYTRAEAYHWAGHCGPEKRVELHDVPADHLPTLNARIAQLEAELAEARRITEAERKGWKIALRTLINEPQHAAIIGNPASAARAEIDEIGAALVGLAEARKDGERLEWLLFDHGFRVGYNFEDRASIDSSMRGTR